MELSPLYGKGDLVILKKDINNYSEKSSVWKITTHAIVNDRDIVYSIFDIHYDKIRTAYEDELFFLCSEDDEDDYLIYKEENDNEWVKKVKEELIDMDLLEDDNFIVDDVVNFTIIDSASGERIIGRTSATISTNMKSERIKSKNFSLSNEEWQEEMDELLDRYNDTKRLIEADGQEDKSLQEQLNRILEEMEELNEVSITNK